MNQRIRELSEQAREYATTRHPVSNIVLSVNSEKFEEKFAELIVRECVKSTLSLFDTAIDNEWNLDETFHVIVDTMVEDLDMQHIFRVDEQQKVASKPKCSVCGTTENVKYMGGYQPYLCDSVDCIPF